jgi:hypothetical protein
MKWQMQRQIVAFRDEAHERKFYVALARASDSASLSCRYLTAFLPA